MHAGDIAKPEILRTLAAIAPVTAVRGNNDTGHWAESLPATRTVCLGGATVFVLHDLSELATHRPAAGVDVIVGGHSHQPRIERQASGVLVVNPGSAGPRRFKLPVTAAELLISGDDALAARIVPLI